MILYLISLLLLSVNAETTKQNSTVRVQDYYANYSLAQQNENQLKNSLHEIIASTHEKQNQAPDKLVDKCESSKSCYSHKDLGYHTAREYLFGEIYLEKVNGEHMIEDYYCGQTFTNQQFPAHSGLGENKIPDPNILNTEHTWPQFRFTDKYPESMQKSDLHILLPVPQHVNSIRGSYHFGEVEKVEVQACELAALGKSKEQQTVFEPMDKRKGDVARALFYFAIRYQVAIDQNEENYLRKWHEMDPVDEEESTKNNQIFEKQFNRNPFIDFPELAKQIKDF